MELRQVGKNTYYIANPTNIGIYKIDDTNVYLIDSGNDADAGKKIIKIIEEQGLHIAGIIVTHSNADHIGGNKVIQDRLEAKVLACKIESCFTEYPILEPAFLYGGYPFKEIRNKFLMAKPSKTISLEENLPAGLEYFPIRGHFFDMVGLKTDDDVYFLGDSLFSEETIQKYHIFFIYDVQEFLRTLDYLETLKGRLFIPSHCEATEVIEDLIELNRQKIVEITELIHSYLDIPHTFEETLKFVFDHYGLTMNESQYVLIGSTLRSYLSYLKDENRITYYFENNEMYWCQSKRS